MKQTSPVSRTNIRSGQPLVTPMRFKRTAVACSRNSPIGKCVYRQPGIRNRRSTSATMQCKAYSFAAGGAVPRWRLPLNSDSCRARDIARPVGADSTMTVMAFRKRAANRSKMNLFPEPGNRQLLWNPKIHT